jgi:hypothetical protein
MKRFDVDNDVGDPIELLPNQKSGSCGEIMGILQRHLWIDLKMKLDVILKASLTGVNLLNAVDAGFAQGYVPNARNSLLVRHGVHELIACVSHDMQCGKQNDEPYSKSAPMISGGEMLGIMQRQGKREQGDHSGHDLNSVMPGVRYKRGAPDAMVKSELSEG